MADSLLDFFLDEHAWQQEAGRVGENGAERDGAGALVDGDFAELQLAGLVVAGAVLEQEAAGDLVGAGALDLSAAEFALEAEDGRGATWRGRWPGWLRRGSGRSARGLSGADGVALGDEALEQDAADLGPDFGGAVGRGASGELGGQGDGLGVQHDDVDGGLGRLGGGLFSSLQAARMGAQAARRRAPAMRAAEAGKFTGVGTVAFPCCGSGRGRAMRSVRLGSSGWWGCISTSRAELDVAGGRVDMARRRLR